MLFSLLERRQDVRFMSISLRRHLYKNPETSSWLEVYSRRCLRWYYSHKLNPEQNLYMTVVCTDPDLAVFLHFDAHLCIYGSQAAGREKKCSECPKFIPTQRVVLSKPSILQTWVFYPAGNLLYAHLYKDFPPSGTPGNVCRKDFLFPVIPGNLNWWNPNDYI